MYQIEWPYPIRYGEEKEVDVDVLVLGGGPAGCEAAISAARRGATVALVEKSTARRSGSEAGTGVDHWLNTPNPYSKISADEILEWESQTYGEYYNGISKYIAAREGYETLLELEEMGGKIRDTEDEFKGSEFRDEQSKFLFAYDYENKIHFRVWGSTFKPVLAKECKKLGVQMFDRVTTTSLLTEGGKQGARVVGATGLHSRTGQFYIFTAKATILCMGGAKRNADFTSELTGLHSNIVGTGHAIAWKAGAEFAHMHRSFGGVRMSSGYTYPPYGTGNPFNTWQPCNMVDANGKEIPWVDKDGKVIENMSDRSNPGPDQKYLGERCTIPLFMRPHIVSDLNERIKKGEYTLPLYADLPGMPDDERRVIWGVMVGNEGKTKIPILKTYGDAGFDPSKDMLQSYLGMGWVGGAAVWAMPPNVKLSRPGGLVNDWDLKTTLDGLYAAGDALYGVGGYQHACATGRYAGRKAVEHSLKAKEPMINRGQVEKEKSRVYAPTKREEGMEWKELNAGICRIIQSYANDLKSKQTLELGLRWYEDIKDTVVPTIHASDPHKLMRTLDVYDILTNNEIIMHADLARDEQCEGWLNFTRAGKGQEEPEQWRKITTIKQRNEAVEAGEMPIDFYGEQQESYESHNPDKVIRQEKLS